MNTQRTALGSSLILRLFLLALCGSLVTKGATLHVLNLNDTGAGSLRNRIAVAAPGDVIVFDVPGTIYLNSSIAINKELTLQGPGASVLAISGSNKDRIFTTSGGPIVISKLTLRDGLVVGADGTDGGIGQDGGIGGWAAGGAINNAGDLTLVRCWIATNRVVGGTGGRGGDNVLGTAYTPGTGGAGGLAYGGGIYSAVHTFRAGSCTFSGNRAEGGKGGRGGDNLNFAVPKPGGTGGIGGKGQAGGLGDTWGPWLTNCTLSGNLANGGEGGRGGDTAANVAGGQGGDGGEGYCGGFYGFQNVGGFLLWSSTVVLNEAHGGTAGAGGNGSSPGSSGGPGIGRVGGVGGYMGSCINALGNTILALNRADLHPNQEVSFQDNGYNFLGDDDNPGPCMNSSLTKMGTLGLPLDPLLGPLTQNGGGVPTHAPLTGSPVIDQGFSFYLPTDQRNAPRPYDFGNIPDFYDGNDIGAVELGSTPLGMSKGGGGGDGGGKLVLSWPAYYGDLKLQSVSNLQGPDGWTDVREEPVLIEDMFYVTNRMTDPSRFFRLINRGQ
jgi:hypothetical protein